MKSRKPKRHQKRSLRLQSLESRQLLAAEFGDSHNPTIPEDVNDDGVVTSVDALMVINRMGRAGGGDADDRPAFRDVNADGEVTSVDVLRIINRMGRERRGDQNPPRPTDPPLDPVEPVEEEIRSIDGTGNNLADPALGSAGTELRRLVDSDYADGISEPSGEDRLSAREISNILADQEETIPNANGLSDLVWQWGQFIDHDITLTEEDHSDDPEAFNIAVPTGDEFFDPFGTGVQEIGLTRSGVAEGTGVDSAREQVNGITAFIDGSMVYGSDAETAESLRELAGGRLATSENDLLPIDETGFFAAGDVRANEQNGLTAMHTLWVREHNRIADEIAANDPDLTDEEIYQQAREIVIAEIQAITYNEYLPTLLGRNAISDYEGYDESVDPSISNLFATAAFRYGHTSLSSELQRLDDDGNVIEEGNILLRDAFFNPSGVIELGIDPLLKGLASNVAQEIDNQLVDDVRNFLFGPPGSGGFDLAALNIQRGRDHGLPDYNSAREQLGLTPAESFADITSNEELQARLAEAYASVDDIDVWVGMLAEDHVRGGNVGELTQAVLVEQFTALRDGDRFWYQNTMEGSELREIERTRLSDVIERNTDLTSIQENAFVVPGAAEGPNRGDRNDRPDRSERDPDADPDPQPTPLPTPPNVPVTPSDVDPEADPVPDPPRPEQPQAPANNRGEGEPNRGRRDRGGPNDEVARPTPEQDEAGLDTGAVDEVLAEIGRVR